MTDLDDALTTAREAYARLTPASARHHVKRLAVLPGGDTRQSTYFDPYPLVIDRGDGPYVWDLDGRRLVDLTLCFSAAMLGHAHPAVVEAVTTQLERGAGFTGVTEHEAEVAEAICGRLPSVERVRFASTGTEAALLAVRAARAGTGRPVVALATHGFHSSYDQDELGAGVGGGGPQPGPDAPHATVTFTFNDADDAARAVERAGPRLAAVLVEPMLGVGGMIPPAPGFLQHLRDLTRGVGALLVLDEVMTLRLAVGGGQERFGMEQPDLTVMGKVLAGGLPLAAVGGSEAAMRVFDVHGRQRIRHSGTFLANPVSLAAARAVLPLLDAAAIATADRAGERLATGLRALLAASGLPLSLSGTGSLWNLHGRPDGATDVPADPRMVALLHLALLERGVLVGARGLAVTGVPTHDGVVDEALDGFADAIDHLAKAIG